VGKSHHPAFIEIGVITRPHGITGEVKVQTSPGYLGALEGIKRVYLNNSPTGTSINGQRIHQNAILLRLEGVDTRNAAEVLRGTSISIKVPELPRLAEGEYYAHELVGLKVQDVEGKELGQVSEVLATGSNDVYIIKTSEGRELLLPAIESVIRKIDFDASVMTVIVPEGLNG
jgi:16S rRNA processing protein RimM